MMKKIKQKYIVGMILVITLFLSYQFSIFYNCEYTISLIIIIILISLIISNFKKILNRKLKLFFCIVISIKIILLIYQSINQNIPMGGIDWVNFERYAKNALDNTNSFYQLVLYDINIFPKIVSIIYYFLGYKIYLIYYLVFIFSLVLFNTIYSLANILYDNKNISSKFAIIISVIPINFIFSITYLREIPIQTIIALSILYILKYEKDSKVTNLIMALTFAFIAIMFHAGNIALIIAYLIFLGKKSKDNFSMIIIAILTILSIYYARSFVLGKFLRYDSIENYVESAQIIRGNTTYIYSAPTSIIGTFAYLPYRVLMYVGAPFIFQIQSLSTMIAFLLDGVFRNLFLIGIILNFKKRKSLNIQNNYSKYIRTILLISYVIFALGTSNYGTAMRHRSKYLVLELILIYDYLLYYIYKRKENKSYV